MSPSNTTVSESSAIRRIWWVLVSFSAPDALVQPVIAADRERLGSKSTPATEVRTPRRGANRSSSQAIRGCPSLRPSRTRLRPPGRLGGVGGSGSEGFCSRLLAIRAGLIQPVPSHRRRQCAADDRVNLPDRGGRHRLADVRLAFHLHAVVLAVRPVLNNRPVASHGDTAATRRTGLQRQRAHLLRRGSIGRDRGDDRALDVSDVGPARRVLRAPPTAATRSRSPAERYGGLGCALPVDVG